MSDLTKLSDLHAATEQHRVDFLQTDLALCFTFADLVQTECGMADWEAAQSVLEKAETGYATIARFLPEVKNADQRFEIAQKLAELRARLDSERRRFDP
jgi:hypothetical protein